VSPYSWDLNIQWCQQGLLFTPDMIPSTESRLQGLPSRSRWTTKPQLASACILANSSHTCTHRECDPTVSCMAFIEPSFSHQLNICRVSCRGIAQSRFLSPNCALLVPVRSVVSKIQVPPSIHCQFPLCLQHAGRRRLCHPPRPPVTSRRSSMPDWPSTRNGREQFSLTIRSRPRSRAAARPTPSLPYSRSRRRLLINSGRAIQS